MKCTSDRMAAYRDGALSPAESMAMEAHLAECAACRAELELLRHRRDLVEGAISRLDPAPLEAPEVRSALAAVRQRAAMSGETDRSRADSPRPVTEWRRSMSAPGIGHGRARAIGIATAAAVALAALFAFAPVRHAAAEFLSVFRVKRLEVVAVRPERASQLQDLESLLASGVLGQPTVLREPSEPTAVQDAASASRLAGFEVRVPEDLPESAQRSEFVVATGPHLLVEAPAETVSAALSAAGIDDVPLPARDTFSLEVDVPAVVVQTYRFGPSEMRVVQAPSPTIVLPPGIPPAELGRAFLQLTGMDGEAAARMASEIDWSSTLVLPIPEDLAEFSKVRVGGADGLLLRARPEGGPAESMVIWESDGILNAVAGRRVIEAALLRTAASLR